MDTTTIAIAGVVLIPLIIGIVQFAKKLAPGAEGRVWLAASMLLGIAGQTVAFIIASGVPADLKNWAALVVMGFSGQQVLRRSHEEMTWRPIS